MIVILPAVVAFLFFCHLGNVEGYGPTALPSVHSMPPFVPLVSALCVCRYHCYQVSRKVPMSDEARDVALADIARSPKSAAFTGADLQALVDTAQLAAIHSFLEVSDA